MHNFRVSSGFLIMERGIPTLPLANEYFGAARRTVHDVHRGDGCYFTLIFVAYCFDTEFSRGNYVILT